MNYNVKDDVESIIEGKEELTFMDKVAETIRTKVWVQIILCQVLSFFVIFCALLIYLNVKRDEIVLRDNYNGMLIIGIFFAIIIVDFALWFFCMRSTLKPLFEINDSIKDLENGNLFKTIEIKGDNELWNFAKSYNHMASELATQKMEAAYQFEARMKAVELQNSAERMTIESQININFLKDVVAYIENNYKEITVSLINDIMGRLLEVLLYLNPQNEMTDTIGSELEFVENYLHIQQIIRDKRFEYEIDISPTLMNWPASRLMLLPFVENSLIHGFENKYDDCMIKIFAHDYQNRLELSIWDNGKGLDENVLRKLNRTIKSMKDLDINLEAQTYSMNIQNIIAKLYSFYGDRLDIKIKTVGNEGTEIVLYLPIPNKFSWQGLDE